MKISELIADMQEVFNEHGDLEAYIYTDHGQTDELVGYCGASYFVEEGGELCSVHPDDEDSYQDKFMGYSIQS